MIAALSETSKLIILVLSAILFLVIGDTIGKILTSNGLEPFIVAWSRFIIGALIILPFSGIKLCELKLLLNRMLILRAFLIAGSIFCLTVALKTEPIANVFGGFFIAPVISYILAIVILKEKPSRIQSFLLSLGFLGVIIVVKPGFGLSTGMIFALMTGIFYGGYLASTKMIALRYKPRFLLISQLLIGSIILAPLGVINDITIPIFTMDLSLLLLGSAIFSAAGNYFLVIANRMGEASLIAPLVYVQLIYGAIIGVVIFNDIPDITSTIGLVLILLSGFGSILIAKKRAVVVKVKG